MQIQDQSDYDANNQTVSRDHSDVNIKEKNRSDEDHY